MSKYLLLNSSPMAYLNDDLRWHRCIFIMIVSLQFGFEIHNKWEGGFVSCLGMQISKQN
jgi:hypothetical protein